MGRKILYGQENPALENFMLSEILKFVAYLGRFLGKN